MAEDCFFQSFDNNLLIAYYQQYYSNISFITENPELKISTAATLL